jgi:glycosyltransferase involved in cell wall biosynthesis
MTTTRTEHVFTVFTPTYNRAHTLPRLYASLSRQTFRDFEWLIVDDGSTDDTREAVSGFQRVAWFPVRYFFQDNSGKHVAFNRGVREAAGELFLNVDSDDALVPEALERLKHHWDAIPGESRSRFSAVTALCVDEHGRTVGDPFPRDPMDSDSLEYYFRMNVAGEKFGFHRTDVLREHPFPEPDRVKFVPEVLVWFAIARRYRTRFVNERLRIYHQGDPEPRLTTLTPQTACGRAIFCRAVLNDYADYAWSSPARMAKTLVNFSRYSFLSGVGLPAQLRQLEAPGCRAAAALAAPLGYALFLRDQAMRRSLG